MLKKDQRSLLSNTSELILVNYYIAIMFYITINYQLTYRWLVSLLVLYVYIIVQLVTKV